MFLSDVECWCFVACTSLRWANGLEKKLEKDTPEEFFQKYQFLTLSTCRNWVGRDARLLNIQKPSIFWRFLCLLRCHYVTDKYSFPLILCFKINTNILWQKDFIPVCLKIRLRIFGTVP
ncbi:MAG TPA: hypothetical protein DDY31_14630 [Lachnospiraceae bacterium]|nr:hypothetical protein [Lachnospiraceae bacterium]